MGADKAVTVAATVIELLPNATVRVALDNQQQVLTHSGAATATNFVRVRPGDRVEVALSPHDRTRGRITRLLRKGSGSVEPQAGI